MKAAKTYSLVSAQDPLVRYIRNVRKLDCGMIGMILTPKIHSRLLSLIFFQNRELSPCEKIYERLGFSVYLILCIQNKVALTIGRGIGNITALSPSLY